MLLSPFLRHTDNPVSLLVTRVSSFRKYLSSTFLFCYMSHNLLIKNSCHKFFDPCQFKVLYNSLKQCFVVHSRLYCTRTLFFSSLLILYCTFFCTSKRWLRPTYKKSPLLAAAPKSESGSKSKISDDC